MTKHSHYFKDVAHLKQVDVYRVLDLFAVTSPSIQHAVKKLLCAGSRGAKDYEKDLREAVDSIRRALQMIAEDDSKAPVVEWPADESRIDAIGRNGNGGEHYPAGLSE